MKIDFNHISSKLEDGEVSKLKKWYKHNHKRFTCYKWKYKRAKKIRLLLNMVSTGLVVVGTVVGGVTMNPVVLGCVSGGGVMIQAYMTKSGLNTKVEMCRFAHTSYRKVLTQLESYLNGVPYDEVTFLTDCKVVDDIVADLCPTINGMADKYDRIYCTT